MRLEDILKVEGIVIRKIPEETVKMWSYSERLEKLPDFELVVDEEEEGRKKLKEVVKNTLGGKYLVSLEFSQDSLVRFNKKTCGVGDTIEEAYTDLILNKIRAV